MSDLAVNVSPELLAAFCRRWRIRELSLFGSAIRDDFSPTSDVDVLVDFEVGVLWGIDEWIVMRDELEAMFRRRVDLVSRASLRNPFRRAEILRTRRVLHAA
ncbi:MAG: nucleotidyltransferase domain-containing protein [Planctomycetota bacterium]|nr:nucleotidyltransferase domain-containing protein [Planctomycetota bacterium]